MLNTSYFPGNAAFLYEVEIFGVGGEEWNKIAKFHPLKNDHKFKFRILSGIHKGKPPSNKLYRMGEPDSKAPGSHYT